MVQTGGLNRPHTVQNMCLYMCMFVLVSVLVGVRLRVYVCQHGVQAVELEALFALLLLQVSLWDVRQGERGGLIQRVSVEHGGTAIYALAW